jgi:hypothetical protein
MEYGYEKRAKLPSNNDQSNQDGLWIRDGNAYYPIIIDASFEVADRIKAQIVELIEKSKE